MHHSALGVIISFSFLAILLYDSIETTTGERIVYQPLWRPFKQKLASQRRKIGNQHELNVEDLAQYRGLAKLEISGTGLDFDPRVGEEHSRANRTSQEQVKD